MNNTDILKIQTSDFNALLINDIELIIETQETEKTKIFTSKQRALQFFERLAERYNTSIIYS